MPLLRRVLVTAVTAFVPFTLGTLAQKPEIGKSCYRITLLSFTLLLFVCLAVVSTEAITKFSLKIVTCSGLRIWMKTPDVSGKLHYVLS